jgi:WD40 repeat protein
MVAERLGFETSEYPCNAIAFDKSSSVMAIASEDSNIYMHNVETGEEISTLQGHTDSV